MTPRQKVLSEYSDAKCIRYPDIIWYAVISTKDCGYGTAVQIGNGETIAKAWKVAADNCNWKN